MLMCRDLFGWDGSFFCKRTFIDRNFFGENSDFWGGICAFIIMGFIYKAIVTVIYWLLFNRTYNFDWKRRCYLLPRSFSLSKQKAIWLIRRRVGLISTRIFPLKRFYSELGLGFLFYRSLCELNFDKNLV